MEEKEPILFDPDQPYAHYERARKLKLKTDSAFNTGKVVSIAAFLIGAVCVVFNPKMMAVHALFGLVFTIFSVAGCWLRRPKLCLASIPLGIIASLAAGLSGSELAPLGTIAFICAVLLQFRAISAASVFYTLKELPGFPFFDPTMDDLTFAAKDRFGSDEFIEGDDKDEKPARYVPLLEPSQEMKGIYAPHVPEMTEKEIREMEGDKVWTYEHHRESDLSDVDLFK